jgi:hypothetical protein
VGIRAVPGSHLVSAAKIIAAWTDCCTWLESLPRSRTPDFRLSIRSPAQPQPQHGPQDLSLGAWEPERLLEDVNIHCGGTLLTRQSDTTNCRTKATKVRGSYYGTTGTVHVGASMCRCHVGAPSPGPLARLLKLHRELVFAVEVFLALSSSSGRRRNDVAEKGWNHDDSQPLRGMSH